MIQKSWALVINDRFFYTRELLLGVNLSRPNALTRPVEIRVQKPRLQLKSKTKSWRIAFLLFLVLVIGLLGVFTVPNLYYQVFPADTIELKPTVIGSPIGGAFDSQLQEPDSEAVLPVQDPTLPQGDWLIIPGIGVQTEFKATETADEALKTAAWLDPAYGKPGDTGLPIIIAAHRFGWSWWWQSDYGRLHSFYYLPTTKAGDLVEIISDQRKWTYEIFAAEEGEEITNYNADLVLYTCKHLSSPIRYIRYARLVTTE